MKQNNRVNIREIAQRAGVSVASVSRALNEKQSASVSPRLQNRISRVCEELKYYPNTHMVRMYSNRANTIAFIYPPNFKTKDRFEKGKMDPNLGAILTGVEEVLSEESLFITLAATTKKFLEKKEYLKFFRSKMVDGMIIWGWEDSKHPYLQELIDEKVPLVMVQCGNDKLPVSYVTAKDYEGMISIVDRVVSLGHRKIAVASPLPGSSQGEQRLKGIIDGLKKHKLEPCYITKEGNYSFDFGYKAGLDILKNAPQATCIMAANDMVAKGIIEAALKKNIKIPQELSVTGADGLSFAENLQLTTYIFPAYQIGIEGAKIIKKLIKKPNSKPIKLNLPVTLIEGNTTAHIEKA